MLEIRDLSVGYGRRRVLEQINLKASEGEVVGVIGPNGSGKTTLLKAITKVLEPISGTVHINGTNVDEMQSKEIAKKVAVVSQVISINFEFTVEDIVLMGRTPYIKGSETVEDINIVRDADINIVRDAMEKTNTLFLKDRLITQLSGGELQRVIIARAFAQNPNILSRS
jgi:iron complex transport system ATP-binding protein